MGASESPVLGTFKAHKILPRRKLGEDEPTTKRSAECTTPSPTRPSKPGAIESTQRMNLWITEPNQARAMPLFARPLTPPLNIKDTFKSWMDDEALRNGEYPPTIADSDTTTPLAQLSPPTPETTPPKAVAKGALQAPPSPSRNISGSRTESFKTAHEDFSTEDESDALDSPSLHPSRRKWLKTAGFSKQENIGLGLGLDLGLALDSEEDDETTPRRATGELDKDDEFIAFNGVWGGLTPDRISGRLRRRTRKSLNADLHETPLVRCNESPLSATYGDIVEPSLRSVLRLCERAESTHHDHPGRSTEQFTEQTQWPRKDDDRDVDAEIRLAEEKRLSQVSTNSTVVAAMVLDCPPRRRRTLRHTGKILDVNTSDTAPIRSNRTSVNSTRRSLGHQDRNMRGVNEGMHNSSTAGISDGASKIMARQRDDPLIVLPDRRSSLPSSAESTKRLSKTFSVISQQQSSRPTTAPEEAKSYFDMPRRDRRAVSVVLQQARPLKPEDNVNGELASPPLSQLSPRSAPTSTARSTASGTSGGIIAHYVPTSPPIHWHSTLTSLDPHEVQEPISDPAVVGDWSAFRPAHFTPFSLRSAQSSTPGTLEVNEATALTIHPHTNKSILVIQEIARVDKTKPKEKSAVIADNASIAIPGTLTPPIHQRSPPRQMTDSPLQNPREPPQPPDFIKVIPPTPANVPLASEDTPTGRNPSTRTKRMSAPITSIKRAFSARRRYSESFGLSLPRTLSRRNSTSHHRFSLIDEDEGDDRLHPLWRPRRNFDGSEGSGSEREVGNDGFLSPQRTQNQDRSTGTMAHTNRTTDSLRSASLRRLPGSSSVFAANRRRSQALPYEVVDDVIKDSQPLTRRLTDSLLSTRPLRPRRSTRASWWAQPHYEFVHPDVSMNADKNLGQVPGQGYQVQFVGFRGLFDKLERRREFKEEGRREARRNWLRGRIDYAGRQGIMSTIQNLKNFIRHGKQARQAPPHGEPTTNVSPVNAQQQRYAAAPPPAPPPNAQYAVSDPNVRDHNPIHHAQVPGGHFSVANVDNRNKAAQAGEQAAKIAGNDQKLEAAGPVEAAGSTERSKDLDASVIERIVAEERESQGKLPKYPGLEQWTLLEKMGDGAFSNVYRAKDNTGHYGEVAIKVVRKFEMNSTQRADELFLPQRANILKEVQIMRQLDHPSIVQLIDFSESRQYYYIVLELCPGGELFHQIVRLTYFSEDLSRHVIVQVAEALEYLHETAGIVHRDIKPENLLFYPIPFIPTRNPKPKGPEDEDKEDEGEFIKGVGSGGIGKIKIADFGLSKVIWDSQTMTPCGTVGYTAPEIVKDERYSKSVDMWALGCVLYTLLCGFPPFYDESIQVLTEKVARGQYTFLSPWWDDISKSAQDLVSHLLTVDPEKRYTIRQFLNHPWIRQSKQETYAADDAPPLATPLYMRQREYGFSQKYGGTATPEAMSAQFLETPGGGQRRMDFRSPGAVNLREVFDVSYAVHRAEEEGKRRKNFPQGYRGAAGANGLNPLNEDEDAEYDDLTDDLPHAPAQNPPSKLPKPQGGLADVSGVEQKMRSTNLHGGDVRSAAAQARQAAAPKQAGYGQHSPAVAAAAKQQVKKNKGNFELSLDDATLLGRRSKAGERSKLRAEVVQ
ncbi:MAG: hypothetical protein Q9163_005106 [Psora crenata]